jgi:hypothetical protein
MAGRKGEEFLDNPIYCHFYQEIIVIIKLIRIIFDISQIVNRRLSPRSDEFISRLVHMGFMDNNVDLG